LSRPTARITTPARKKLLPAHVVERRARVLEHVKFVEHHIGLLQQRRHRVEIRLPHVPCRPRESGRAAAGEGLGQQSGGVRFAAVLAQPDHLAVDDIGEDRPELMPLPALDLIQADVLRTPLGALLVPSTQERDVRPGALRPSSRVAHRGMVLVGIDWQAEPTLIWKARACGYGMHFSA
jgi:hypothetical protein